MKGDQNRKRHRFKAGHMTLHKDCTYKWKKFWRKKYVLPKSTKKAALSCIWSRSKGRGDSLSWLVCETFTMTGCSQIRLTYHKSNKTKTKRCKKHSQCTKCMMKSNLLKHKTTKKQYCAQKSNSRPENVGLKLTIFTQKSRYIDLMLVGPNFAHFCLCR